MDDLAKMVDFSGQVVFVTGASRGIGRAIARFFARAGASVALASRSAEPLAAVAGEVEAAGGEALVPRGYLQTASTSLQIRALAA